MYMCFRIKLAEERVTDIEKEKLILETKVKTLTSELSDVKEKQSDLDVKAQSNTSKVMAENIDLKIKLEGVNRFVEKAEKQITKCERNISNLEDDISNKNKELASMRSLRNEKLELERKLLDLESELKLKDKKIMKHLDTNSQISKLEREKDNLDTKMKSLEKELSDMKCKEKSGVARRGSKFEDIEDMRQEKMYLETRVSTLQRQIDTADQKVMELEQKLTESSIANDKVKGKFTN